MRSSRDSAKAQGELAPRARYRMNRMKPPFCVEMRRASMWARTDDGSGGDEGRFTEGSLRLPMRAAADAAPAAITAADASC